MKSQPVLPEPKSNSRVTRSGAYSTGLNLKPGNTENKTPPKKFQRGKSAAANKGKNNKGVNKGKRNGKFSRNLAYTNRKAIRILSESGNNELSKEDLSYLTDEEKLLLSSWGLPSSVLNVLVFKIRILFFSNP
jgi:hypothetical protein